MSQLKTLIYGSCVSRDCFEYLSGRDIQHTLIDYVARSSLISATDSRTFRRVPLDAIESSFQRRMVTFDVHGQELFKLTAEADYDIFLVDLIDERFDVYVQGKAHATRSVEFGKSGFSPKREYLLKAGSDKRLTAWQNAWDRLVKHLSQHNQLAKMRINQVYWAYTQTADEPFPAVFTPDYISRNNTALSYMYDYMSKDLDTGQFWEFPEETNRADAQHKWGGSPFHFGMEYYKSLLSKLDAEVPTTSPIHT